MTSTLRCCGCPGTRFFFRPGKLNRGLFFSRWQERFQTKTGFNLYFFIPGTKLGVIAKVQRINDPFSQAAAFEDFELGLVVVVIFVGNGINLFHADNVCILCLKKY